MQNTTTTLQQLHAKLNLSQSSLSSSISNIPERLHFIGFITSYAEIQMVSWQKEVIFTITEGSIETLRISMWLNHDNPLGVRFAKNEPLIGRLAYFKNVKILSFDFTRSNELQFYGEMNPPSNNMHTILFPIISGGAYMHFLHRETPFKINPQLSVIPKLLLDKRSTAVFPLLDEDKLVLQKIIGLLVTFTECLSKKITFSPAQNPFQEFVNLQISSYNNPTQREIRECSIIMRRSKHWLTSYYQHLDWYSKQKQ